MSLYSSTAESCATSALDRVGFANRAPSGFEDGKVREETVAPESGTSRLMIIIPLAKDVAACELHRFFDFFVLGVGGAVKRGAILSLPVSFLMIAVGRRPMDVTKDMGAFCGLVEFGLDMRSWRLVIGRLLRGMGEGRRRERSNGASNVLLKVSVAQNDMLCCQTFVSYPVQFAEDTPAVLRLLLWPESVMIYRRVKLTPLCCLDHNAMALFDFSWVSRRFLFVLISTIFVNHVYA